MSVDGQMSLLALEKDTLPLSLYAMYQDNGVPALTDNEILIKPEKCPKAPSESVLFDFGTSVQTAKALLPDLNISVLNGVPVLLFNELFSTGFSVRLLDVQGRVVYKFTNVYTSGRSARLTFRPGLKGTFVVQVISNEKRIRRKIVLF